jgi:hypothetical protein
VLFRSSKVYSGGTSISTPSTMILAILLVFRLFRGSVARARLSLYRDPKPGRLKFLPGR